MSRRMANALVAKGLLEPQNAERAAEDAERLGIELGQIVVERGWVPDARYADVVAEVAGWERMHLEGEQIEIEIATRFDEAWVRTEQLLPLRLDRREVEVAVVEEGLPGRFDDIAFRFGRKVRVRVVARKDFERIVRHVFHGDPLIPFRERQTQFDATSSLDLEEVSGRPEASKDLYQLVKENRQAAEAVRALYELCVDKGVIDRDDFDRRLANDDPGSNQD